MGTLTLSFTHDTIPCNASEQLFNCLQEASRTHPIMHYQTEFLEITNMNICVHTCLFAYPCVCTCVHVFLNVLYY
jgi:hypothetical protein